MLTPSPDTATEQFGSYEVFERLGLGGMATVYRAKKRGPAGFERSVALKRMLQHLAEDPAFVESFVREAKVASLLQHPNIAQIYDFGRISGTYYIAMELVAGFDVRKLLRYANRANEAIPLAVLLSILGELCDALDYAHTFVDEAGTPLNIVHRDISPSNLIVAHTGHLKVIDFGIAKASSRQLHTASGQVKGKLGYMSPEVALGLPAGPVSDLFSVGVVAWELGTASPLFSARTDFETMRKIREEAIAPPSKLNPSLPAKLDAIILGALQREPEDRVASARAFRAVLDEIATEAGVHVSPRTVAEWMLKFVQPADSWAHAASVMSSSAAGPTTRARPTTGARPATGARSATGTASPVGATGPRSATGTASPVGATGPKSATGATSSHPAESPTAILRTSRPSMALVRSPDDIQLATEIWGDDSQTATEDVGDDFHIQVQPPPTRSRMRPAMPPAAAPTIRPPAAVGSQALPLLVTTAPGAPAQIARTPDPPPNAPSSERGSTSPPRPAKRWLLVLFGGLAMTAAALGAVWFARSSRDRRADAPAGRAQVGGATASAEQPDATAGAAVAADMDGPPVPHDSDATDGSTPASTTRDLAPDDSRATKTRTRPATKPATPKPAMKRGRQSAEPTKPGKQVADADTPDIMPEATKPETGKPLSPPPVPAVAVTQPPKPAEPARPVETRPARTPGVAASAVTKLSGDVPTLRAKNAAAGDVLARMCIDESGRVSSVKIVKADPAIAGELQTALASWRYKPYLKDDRPSPVCFPLSLRVVVKNG